MLSDFIPELNTYVVLFYNSKILILKRKNTDFWEFPGGGVEFGEHPEKTALRETKEETGLNVYNISFLGITSAVYLKDGKQKHSVYIIYKGEVSSDSFVCSSEHEAGRWITPDELEFVKLALNAQAVHDFLE